MKKFVNAEIELILIEAADIITTSPTDGDNSGGFNGEEDEF